MKVFKTILTTLVFSILALTSVSAQKYGYVNSQAILQSMPAVKAANAEMESLQKQLESKYQKMVKDYQTKALSISQKQQNGELSPKQVEDEAKKLTGDEESIRKYELQIKQQLAKKQETLLKPIYDKLENAIKTVAKEKGFTMIFDYSAGSILYADPSTNLESAIKAKLGMS